uniref:Transcription factor A, mitochondrial n=1 Tax=Aceria tosichella TaxID=561515 RepID=A0A6G1S5T6_9ACAR
MLTFKIVSSCSMRGMPAIVSNQTGLLAPSLPTSSHQQQPKCNLNLSSHDSSLAQSQRYLSASGVYYQAMFTRKQHKIPATLENVNLPERPKKPPTPWISFVRERKDEVFRQRGKITAAQLAVILAPEWKQVDKSRYEEEYKRKHEEYMKLVENYQSSLTPEQVDLLDFMKTAKRETKASKLLRKTNPPVLPRNSANLYCHERSKQDDFKEMLKYKKAAQVFSDIFREYREMSEEKKKKYIELQEEDKARFQHEFLEWYEGVQTDENLTKAARDQANMMRDRYKALNYI